MSIKRIGVLTSGGDAPGIDEALNMKKGIQKMEVDVLAAMTGV